MIDLEKLAPLPEPCQSVLPIGWIRYTPDQMRALRLQVARAVLEEAAKEFDRRDNGIGFYDPHEPAEIIRSLLPSDEGRG